MGRIVSEEGASKRTKRSTYTRREKLMSARCDILLRSSPLSSKSSGLMGNRVVYLPLQAPEELSAALYPPCSPNLLKYIDSAQCL